MDKKEREIRQQIDELKNEAQGLIEEGKQEEAKAKIEEAKQLKEELDTRNALNDIQLPAVPQPGTPAKPQDGKEDITYAQVFSKALRKEKLNEAEMKVMQEYHNAMTSGTDADGGFIVPEDVTTTINELKQTVDNLEQYVTVERVSTDSGQRTLEVRADSTPFASMSELGSPDAMQDMGNPTFQRIAYAIDKYAGFMVISNDLLKDTDQALMNYVSRWIAKKSKATRNSLILDVLNALSKVTFADYSDIKKTLNVDLDPAHAQNAIVMTNQDGYNYLDQQEDGDGRPLLQPDPTSPTRKLLFGKTVVVLSNKTLASTDNGDGTFTHPFIIGDLKEAVVLFDREQYSIDMTREGGNAWKTDSTELRAIEREDVKAWDSEAVVYGQITA